MRLASLYVSMKYMYSLTASESGINVFTDKPCNGTVACSLVQLKLLLTGSQLNTKIRQDKPDKTKNMDIILLVN